MHYRRQVVDYILAAIDESKDPAINVLQAMRMASMAWHSVTPTTISNCFKKCGFPANSSEIETEDAAVHDDDAQWDRIREVLHLTEDTTFSDFVDVDDAVLTTGLLEDEEIVNQVSASLENVTECADAAENEDEQLEDTEPPVMRKDALRSIHTLRLYFEKCDNVDTRVFTMLNDIECALRSNCKSVVQTKITSFFASH